MGLLDQVIARSSRIEHERDQWQKRALEAEKALELLRAAKLPTFEEQSVAAHIVKIEDSSVRAALRQEICGLWARIAGLEAQLREVRRLPI